MLKIFFNQVAWKFTDIKENNLGENCWTSYNFNEFNSWIMISREKNDEITRTLVTNQSNGYIILNQHLSVSKSRKDCDYKNAIFHRERKKNCIQSTKRQVKNWKHQKWTTAYSGWNFLICTSNSVNFSFHFLLRVPEYK